MDQSKLKVILLGFNGELLKNVADRVNEQRPVVVSYYTDLKDFLEICLEEQPDLIGVSISYPHQRISQFPKVFKMALNLPVLVFGESQDFKARKALSSAAGDLKIQGVITAHNLWMKIVNFQKMQEDELERSKNGDSKSDKEAESETVFLKDKRPKIEGNKSSILSNLFSALNDDGKTKPQSNMNMIKDLSGPPKQNTMAYGEGSPSNTKKEANFAHLTGGEEAKSVGSGRTSEAINDKAKLLDDLLENQLETKSKTVPKVLSLTNTDDELDKPDFGGVTQQVDNPEESSQEGFGKVQLADAKEVKEDNSRKNKEKIQRDQVKKRNVLEVGSELALEKVFKAPRAKSIKRFDSTTIHVLTVDLGSIKGYLLLTQSHPSADLNMSDFKKTLISALKEQGAFGEVSDAYQISINVKNYVASISEFSDFNINHEDSSENYFNIAFVQREMILPSLQDSDKSDMYFVDIKVIPPQTPVTFDAFLYLPRNQKFVRYLKAGRSLSLKQAKRHTEEEDGQSQLYLPKDQKKQFEQFYIQNTLSWEFELHKKDDVA